MGNVADPQKCPHSLSAHHVEFILSVKVLWKLNLVLICMRRRNCRGVSVEASQPVLYSSSGHSQANKLWTTNLG